VEQVSRDFRDFVRYHEAYLCKPVIEEHQLRLAQQLTYLNFENVHIIEALKRYDVKMDLYGSVIRDFKGRDRNNYSLSCVRKFAEIYNHQQARFCPRRVVDENSTSNPLVYNPLCGRSKTYADPCAPSL